ncbi:MAG: hypothetical protein IJF83_13840 [Methanobrevibacter sp.]|nr:hypothetical protein [Methanobrevibacter sp.]
MKNRDILLIVIAIIVVAGVISSFTVFNNELYKSVNESYVKSPTANESVSFNATYFGETVFDVNTTIPGGIDVLQVGNSFVFVDGQFDEFEGMKGHIFQIEGRFTGKTGNATVENVNASGYLFHPDSIKLIK